MEALAKSITENCKNDYEKAQALVDYFEQNTMFTITSMSLTMSLSHIFFSRASVETARTMPQA